MVKTYSILVWICFLFSLALTGFTFYLVFSKSSLIQCYNKDLDEIPCSSVFTTGRKVGFVIIHILALFIQLCKHISLSSPVKIPSNPPSPLPDICVVIRRYVDQLQDEQAYKNDFGLNGNKKNTTSYYPFQSIDSNRGLLNDKH